MEKTIYTSRIGNELIIIFFVLVMVYIGIAFVEGDWLLMISMVGITTLFMLPLKNTTYTIEGMVLKIRVGFYYKQDLDIAGIRKITESDSWVSSPAPDIKNRLDLQCGKAGSVTISPSDKAGFIAHILRLNPHIQVVYKRAVKKQ